MVLSSIEAFKIWLSLLVGLKGVIWMLS